MVVVAAALADEGRGDVAGDDIVAKISVFGVGQNGVLLVKVVAEAVDNEDAEGVCEPLSVAPFMKSLCDIGAHDPRKLVGGESGEKKIAEDGGRFAGSFVNVRTVFDFKVADFEARIVGGGESDHFNAVVGGHEGFSPRVLARKVVPDLLDIGEG